MTNSEAIEILKNIIEFWAYKPTEVKAAKLAIKALEENDKLKDENGTLKRVIKHNEELRCEETKQLKAEIEHLKAELEKLNYNPGGYQFG